MRLNRDLDVVKNRQSQTDPAIIATVEKILADVRTGGDEALRNYARELDGFTGEDLMVSGKELTHAMDSVGHEFTKLLARAEERITEFHKNQVQSSWSMYTNNGAITGQILRPLERVAVYVPGGTAAYPSSVLMNCIPAMLAGVKEIAIFTPVKADGKVHAAILAAVVACDIFSVYKVGGAHAIAAAAYGTASIPKFDKIVGPGNIYVATAKRLVYGEVDIDMVAGPSEILIIADKTANPKYIAADMMSQAEHDPLASSILLSTSEQLIVETQAEIRRQVASMSRKDIILESLQNHGAAIYVKNLEEAFEISNDLAPEHLEILTADPISHLPKVQNAGSIFLGEYTPEPLGDYMSGTNHVLPTGGTAKFYSGLGVYDFVKYSSYSYYPKGALAELKDDVITFAEAEGLDAHANAVKTRFEEEHP
ncbi:MAG: histidinol dehydrogenase [Defluviitaleaceae bacterium]|nr:histidinol dehydrogenase [Defluviitaleaceae bacterium]